MLKSDVKVGAWAFGIVLGLVLVTMAWCRPADGAPIKKTLPPGSSTDLAKVCQPMGELDADGEPLDTPALSVAVLDRWSDTILACVPIVHGECVSFEYPLPQETRPKVWARSYNLADCNGLVSDPSDDWYTIYTERPTRPRVEP